MTPDSKAPELSVRYPTAEELREWSARCTALGDAVKAGRGFMGTAAIRAAIDMDYLARLIDADPVKNIGQWNIVIKVPGRAKGGQARAAKLSPARRKEIAKKAAKARWKQSDR